MAEEITLSHVDERSPAQDNTMRPQPPHAEGTAGSSFHPRAWVSRRNQGHSCQPCRDLPLNWSFCLESLPFCSPVHTLAQHTHRHTYHLHSGHRHTPTPTPCPHTHESHTGASYQDGENQIGVGTESRSFGLPMLILKCLVDIQTEMTSRCEPIVQWKGRSRWCRCRRHQHMNGFKASRRSSR